MNAIYRLIWSLSLNGWVVASELAKGRRKSGRTVRRAVVCGAGLIAFAGSAVADDLPTGGAITAGAGNLSQSSNALTINQSSSQLNVDWQSFSIGKDHSVTFVQPGRDAVAFNRVTGSEVSSIQGALNANGQVFLSNPNGVLFTPTAQVNVGGILATTLGISDEGGGKYSLRGSGDKGVAQQGRITAGEGGTVALVAAQVSNTGAIDAHGGNVLIGAGNAVTLDFGGPVKIRVDGGALNALIEQGGAIRADGGVVYLTAKAAGSLGTAAINHTGITQARSLSTNEKGEIVLLGDMDDGTLNVAGTLDASAPGTADGGFIETSAAHVAIAGDVHITTAAASGHSGTWLIDPNDFIIAASGGNMTGAALTSALGSTSVQISTAVQGTAGGNGDIFVNDSVSWSANTLTLSAERNIQINAALNGSGTAGLALEYGQAALAAGNAASYSVNTPVNLASAGSFSTKLGSDGATLGYTIITSLGAAGSTTGTDLQGISGGLGGRYVLGADLDASATAGWNSGAGFAPVGDGSAFTGVLDGLGHRITDLTINRPGTNFVGLIGNTSPSTILQNVGLQGGSITGNFVVGALVGGNFGGAISNAYATAAVSSSLGYVGALVGGNFGGVISNAYATGTVSSSGSHTGGLVGLGDGGTISNAYATGAVSGTSSVGGLVGDNRGTVSNAYATGPVSGSALSVGGLVGYNSNSGAISNAYATGTVSGIDSVGGLVGYNDSGAISNAYAIGAVSGINHVGGLFGISVTPTVNTYWATDTSGHSTSSGGVGKTLAELMQLSTFAAWGTDIDAQGGTGSVWRIYEGYTTPLLRSFLTGFTVTANDANKTYDAVAWSGGNGFSYSAAPNANLFGTLSYGGAAQGSVNVGAYTLSAKGLYSNQQGYDITFTDGTLSVAKAALSLNAVTQARTYDGTTASAAAVQVVGLQGSDDVTSLTQSFDSRNAGGRTLGVDSGYVVGDGNGGNNYAVTVNTASGSIDKAALGISAVSDSKMYDGTTVSSGAVQVSGLIGGDTISGAKQSFDSANAGIRTLAVESSYTVNDGNGGSNYAVTTAAAGGSIVQPDVPPPPPATVEPPTALTVAISNSQQKESEDAKEDRAKAPAEPISPLVSVKGTGVRLQ